MQKCCMKNSKSSLVRDRELPFKSAFSSLINNETTKPAQGNLKTFSLLFTTPCYSALVPVTCNTTTSVQIWVVPQGSQKYTQDVLMRWNTSSSRWMTDVYPTALENKRLPITYSSFFYHVRRRYLHGVFTSSQPKGTHQTKRVLIPDQGPAPRLLSPGAEAPSSPFWSPQSPLQLFALSFWTAVGQRFLASPWPTPTPPPPVLLPPEMQLATCRSGAKLSERASDQPSRSWMLSITGLHEAAGKSTIFTSLPSPSPLHITSCAAARESRTGHFRSTRLPGFPAPHQW